VKSALVTVKLFLSRKKGRSVTVKRSFRGKKRIRKKNTLFVTPEPGGQNQ
jgi:hypothetical protein